MNSECEKRDDCRMSIGSPDFIQQRKFRGSLVIRGQELFTSNAVKKKCVRLLWNELPVILRSEDSSSSGSALRRDASLSGDGASANLLQAVWQSETGESVMVVEESVLHEKVLFVCRETLSRLNDPGCRQGVEARLGYGQGIGEAIHAGATTEGRDSSTTCNRRGRDIDTERAYVSDCGERFDPAEGDLVWRTEQFGKRHGPFLPVAGSQEGQEDQAGRDGYVEGLCEVRQKERSSSGHSLRQVSCHEAFRGCHGQGQEAGIFTTFWQGSILHQGSEIYASIEQSESELEG